MEFPHSISYKISTTECMRRMVFPKSFSEKLNGVTTKARMRRANTYRTWECIVKQCSDKEGHESMELEAGWSHFAKDNNIQLNDHVVIEYVGNSVLTLFLFDGDCAIKEMWHNPNQQLNYQSEKWGMSVWLTYGEPTMAAACYLSNSKWPLQFFISMEEGFIKDSVITLPLLSARKCIPAADGDIRTLLYINEKPFLVRIKYYKQGGISYTCKMKSGVRELLKYEKNKIGTDSVLAFEVINSDPLAFKVTVFNY